MHVGTPSSVPGDSAADKARTYETSADIKTTATAVEPGANPELVNHQKAHDNAYEILGKAVHPWELPLDLVIEEAGVYLEHLGVARYRMMEVFRDTTTLTLTDADIAGEHLGLTPHTRRIIAGQAVNSLEQHWGFTASTFLNQVRQVPLFLSASGLSYLELLELLDTAFVEGLTTAPNGTDPQPIISREVEGDGCALEDMTLFPLGQSSPSTIEISKALDRVHRFLRLRRALRWSITDMDRAITALQLGRHENSFDVKLDDAFVVELSLVERLGKDLVLPLIELLSWWAPIDTRTAAHAEKKARKSLFERLFLDKSVMNPDDLSFQLLFAELTGGDLAPVAPIAEHAPRVLAALRMSAPDLSLLTSSEVSQQVLHVPASEIAVEPVEGKTLLNLANLSQLHRIASFARKLKLGIRDLLALKAVSEVDPFDLAHLENTRWFVERARKVRASRFTIAEVDYLLRHVSQAPQASRRHPNASSCSSTRSTAG